MTTGEMQQGDPKYRVFSVLSVCQPPRSTTQLNQAHHYNYAVVCWQWVRKQVLQHLQVLARKWLFNITTSSVFNLDQLLDVCVKIAVIVIWTNQAFCSEQNFYFVFMAHLNKSHSKATLIIRYDCSYLKSVKSISKCATAYEMGRFFCMQRLQLIMRWYRCSKYIYIFFFSNFFYTCSIQGVHTSSLIQFAQVYKMQHNSSVLRLKSEAPLANSLKKEDLWHQCVQLFQPSQRRGFFFFTIAQALMATACVVALPQLIVISSFCPTCRAVL